MVLAGNKIKCLSSVNHTTKTIHHYHLHHPIFYLLFERYPGPILESKGIHAIFQKKGKNILKKGKKGQNI